MKLETKPIEDCKRVMNASKQKNTDFEKNLKFQKKRFLLSSLNFKNNS